MPKEGDVRATLLRLSIIVAVAVMLAACGGTTGSGSSSPSSGTIKAPSNLITAGTITFLSDTTYPPQESIDPSTNKAVGFDVDVANAIASKMGLTATIQTQDFSTIIPALLAKKGDAIISAMSITSDRQKQVAFVGYFSAGQSILVKAGNPEGISGISSLCGKKVAVQVTTTEQDTLTAANGADCSSKKITIQTFPTDTDAVQKLKLGAVDAAMDDSPVAAYYVKQDPTSFAIAGKPIAQAPEGIAVDPKNQELLKAIQQAMQAIFNDGTYQKLLQQWNLQDGAIPASGIVVSGNPTG
jgi:polar amino acid transport system substrate-binding protein